MQVNQWEVFDAYVEDIEPPNVRGGSNVYEP